MIPLIQPDLTDLEAQAAYDVVMSGFVNEGALTRRFEEAFARTVGATFAVATTNCTAALAISLKALGFEGREIIVPDITMIGTAMAVVLSGNTPVVVDVRPSDACLDPQRVAEAVTKRTAAVVPVHVNGRNSVGPELLDIARRHNLAVVEDAACCLGSRTGGESGRQLGTLGTVGCFSLAATKIIGTGQGGVIVTNDERLYERASRLKDWGRFRDKSTNHPEVGFNFKFTDIQAAIALKQLERLPELVRRKKDIYARYRGRLGTLFFSRDDPPGFCPWYVDIRAQHLTAALVAKGVGVEPIWPALHQQGAMQLANRESAYPWATALAREILWLPSSTKLTDEQIDYVCDSICEVAS